MKSRQSAPESKKVIALEHFNLALQRLTISDVQTALKQHRDSLGKETHFYHHKNEVGLISFAIFGNCKRQLDQQALSRSEQRLLRRVCCLDIKLINSNIEFTERKERCRNLVLKAQSKTTIKNNGGI